MEQSQELLQPLRFLMSEIHLGISALGQPARGGPGITVSATVGAAEIAVSCVVS